MRLSVYYCYFFLILIPTTYQLEPASVISIIGSVWKLGEWIMELWKDYSNSNGEGRSFNFTGPGGDLDLSLTANINLGSANVLKAFQHISTQIQDLEEKIGGVERTLRRLEHDLPIVVRWQFQWVKLSEYIRPINSLHNMMLRYEKQKDTIEEHTLRDFATEVVSHDAYAPKNLLWHIHDMVKPWIRQRKGIFQNLHDVLKTHSEICKLRSSPQQIVRDLLEILLITDAKGYSLLSFSWLLLKQFNEGNFTTEALMAKETYERRITEKAGAAKEVMKVSSRGYRRCDPVHWQEGVSYLRLKRLLQGYIENEVDIDPSKSCTAQCSDYYYGEQKGCYNNNKLRFCAIQDKCEGSLRDCRFFDADADVCMSADPARRYAYIHYENGRLLGSKDNECTVKYKVDSWWRWIFYHCSFCFCICDDLNASKTERYFSLRSATTDTAANMIMTGIRFVKIEKVISLEIKQAAALPSGDVNITSVSHVPVDSPSLENSIQDVDYMRLDANNRAINLPELIAPQGYVITGARFQILDTHLNFEIRVTPIDFDSGKLNGPLSKWMHNASPTSELSFGDTDVPIRSRLSSTIHEGSDQFVKFTHTSVTMDAAQTTVPYLDSQAVSPGPAQWLSGAGVYYKNSPGYGGFIGLKVDTYDLTPYTTKPKQVDTSSISSNTISSSTI